jgi:hypothetical protein
MIPFHSVLPAIAEKEVRCIHLQPEPGVPLVSGLSPGEYAFVEFYCEDPNCDCRRAFIEVVARHLGDKVLASINCGWEPESFYRTTMSYNPDAPGEIVRGSLDPINTQSEQSQELLKLFQQQVFDEAYKRRLSWHHQLFREEIARRESTTAPSPAAGNSGSALPLPPQPPPPHAAIGRVPLAHRERFKEVAALIEQFGSQHLDVELASFVIELWRRVCARKRPDCLRGKATVWAAALTHVIARMNFLFDRAQPVHLTFDTICDFFQANKNTVGGKASEIERMMRLRQHSEPGLCRREFVEDFTDVRLSNGIVLSWSQAKRMGYVPAEVKLEDLL